MKNAIALSLLPVLMIAALGSSCARTRAKVADAPAAAPTTTADPSAPVLEPAKPVTPNSKSDVVTVSKPDVKPEVAIADQTKRPKVLLVPSSFSASAQNNALKNDKDPVNSILGLTIDGALRLTGLQTETPKVKTSAGERTNVIGRVAALDGQKSDWSFAFATKSAAEADLLWKLLEKGDVTVACSSATIKDKMVTCVDFKSAKTKAK